MNIEIANRLVQLRKKNGLSQEELAAKLGLSRQAVSKWERAEASPDTDNLICLAKLYGVSLDELLKSDEDIDTIAAQTKEEEETKKESNNDRVYFSGGSFHVESEDGDEVHIGKDGIHIHDKDGNHVDIGAKDIIHAEKCGKEIHASTNTAMRVREQNLKLWEGITIGLVAIVVTIVYITLGILFDKSWPYPLVWPYLWVAYLLIPLTTSIFETIRKKKASSFGGGFVMIVLIAFFTLGYFLGAWHPSWVLFLLIPAYFVLADGIDKAIKAKKDKDLIIDAEEDRSK